MRLYTTTPICIATYINSSGIMRAQISASINIYFQGKLFILRTEDGGLTWQQLDEDQSPDVDVGQGGFAASGTCLVVNVSNLTILGKNPLVLF